MRAESESKFSTLFQEATKVAETLGVVLQKPRLVGISLYRSSTAMEQSAEVYFRINAYNPMFDEVLRDFSDRFGVHFQRTAALHCFLPSVIPEKTWNDVKSVCELYQAFCVGKERDEI